jgi:adenylosuccinate synthase
LLVSSSSHLVFPHHIGFDALREDGIKAQGSTKSGISFVAADKFLREGLRLESIATPKILYEHAYEGMKRLNGQFPKSAQKSDAELKEVARDWLKSVEELRPYIADTVEVINDQLNKGERVLAEGAQAFWLDINHGMYPAVTSSSTTVSGLLDGLGVSTKNLGKVIGVAKSVKSHVGGGPFVTEITDASLADTIRGAYGQADSEYGATTKRPRRVGYPDLVELRNAIRINGVDELALSKLDHVPRYGDTIKLATTYNYNGEERSTSPTSALALTSCTPNYVTLKTWHDDISGYKDYDALPPEAIKFVEIFENELNIPITKIGVGPGRQQVIELTNQTRG